MIAFNDLLTLHSVAPKDVNVMLHSPREANFAAALSGFALERPELLDTYQSYHSFVAERTLSQGRPFVAVFIKIGPGLARGTSRCLFAGIFRNSGSVRRPIKEIAANPNALFLYETFGVMREFYDQTEAKDHMVFNLSRETMMGELVGRLVVTVRLTQNYVRLAENLDAPITSLTEEAQSEVPPPHWRRLAFSGAFLRALPNAWAQRLREWRGIYLIVDESDGARYVGSAYGEENLLARWQAHVARKSGVTVELKKRDPANFRFSILERVSPDMGVDEITELEQTWMIRLHTKDFGLNR